MFNCPTRGIGANVTQVLGDNNHIGIINIQQFCNNLVRGCDIALSTTARIITLVFDTSLTLLKYHSIVAQLVNVQCLLENYQTLLNTP